MTKSTKDNHNYDYFISYSNDDLALVSQIVSVMENDYKADCWFQTNNSRDEYTEEIIKGIEHSKTFLIFLSPNSAISSNVKDEINWARRWRESHPDYKILPIVIGPSDFSINEEKYAVINFMLSRLNMLFYKDFDSITALVLKIFDQTNFEIDNNELKESLYHSSVSESKRLHAQNEILRDFSKEFFDKIVKPDFSILDIGCADGENIMLRLENIEYKNLLGVDIESHQIEKAIATYGSDKNTFVNIDVFSSDFDDVLNEYREEHEIIGFDLIHISAVLLHLVEPVKLLKLLKVFLKKNGYIFIQEEDDGANLVHPYSPFFKRAFDIWADSKESGDRHCARKMGAYIQEAGYKKITLAKCGVSNLGLNPEKQNALWDIYFNHHLWLAVEENVFYNLEKTNKLIELYKAEYDKYKQDYDEGKIFIQLGFLFFIVQK